MFLRGLDAQVKEAQHKHNRQPYLWSEATGVMPYRMMPRRSGFGWVRLTHREYGNNETVPAPGLLARAGRAPRLWAAPHVSAAACSVRASLTGTEVALGTLNLVRGFDFGLQ